MLDDGSKAEEEHYAKTEPVCELIQYKTAEMLIFLIQLRSTDECAAASLKVETAVCFFCSRAVRLIYDQYDWLVGFVGSAWNNDETKSYGYKSINNVFRKSAF